MTTKTQTIEIEEQAIQYANRLTNGELPLDVDLKVIFERTSNGLEITVKSQYLWDVLGYGIDSNRRVGNNYSCISTNGNRSHNTYGNIYPNGVNGYVNISFIHGSSVENGQLYNGVKGIFRQVISDGKYPFIRRDIVNALTEYISDVVYVHKKALGIGMGHKGRYKISKVNKHLKPYGGASIIEGVLTKTINGATKIAIEVEGGWVNAPHGMYRDGSVNSRLVPACTYHRENPNRDEDNDGTECTCNGGTGEHSSPICNSLEEINEYIDYGCYPDYMDSSCGLHIHVSFGENMLTYSKLMSPKFWRYYLKRYREWGIRNNINKGSRFWTRMEGTSYAKKLFQPNKQYQLSHKSSERYCMLNYALALHGTLESRMLPMFNESRIAKSAIAEFINIVNTYIADNMDEPIYESEGDMTCV